MEIAKVQQEALAVQKATAPTVEMVNAKTIRSQTDLEQSKGVLAEIMKAKKEVKAKKDAILNPLKESVKEVNALFAPIEKSITDAEAAFKGKMLDYNRKLIAERQKKEAQEAAKIAESKTTLEKAGQRLEKVEEKKAAIPTRKVKKVIIENPDKVPAKYRVIDEVAVRRDALAGIEIPGVIVKEEETIVGRF